MVKPRLPEQSYSLAAFVLLPSDEFNLLVLIDGCVFALRRYWPLPEADDYRPAVDGWRPEWRSFEVYEGRIDYRHTPPLFVGLPLCGSVRHA